MALHFGITIFRNRRWKINSLTTIGVDDPGWGKVVQDYIHEWVNSPKFGWEERTVKPLGEQEISATYTSETLKFDTLNVTGKIVLDGALRAGTRRTEAELGAKVVIEEAHLKGAKADYWEFAAGARARAFVRYNDGRPKPLFGVEAGFIGGVAQHLGPLTLRFDYEALQSTDPALQTTLGPFARARGQHGAPVYGIAGQGAHIKGMMSIVFRW
jgi:hypothetical protein